jgi:protein-S-isoprenylcysteine O-methyltransferase Ste14
MQRQFAALAILLLIGMVLVRVGMMRRRGIKAMNFGELDRKDFLIPPFALFYLYMVLAGAFGLPSPSRQVFFRAGAVAWIGVLLCLAGLVLMVLSLAAFGKSFRVGIDAQHPGELVTTGVFRWTRNPIYVAFWGVLAGEFLAFPNWILLVYVAAGTWLFHRQVLREEESMLKQYGQRYLDYCNRVRRYL